MGGVYGEINSRADFFRVLGEARALARKLLQRSPGDPTLLSINRQLEAIAGWTAGGREPTKQERKSLDMSVRAVRELSNSGDPVVDRFSTTIMELDAYFEDWPTDEQAASATDDDFFDSDEDEDDDDDEEEEDAGGEHDGPIAQPGGGPKEKS
jgi:hypothetical protein